MMEEGGVSLFFSAFRSSVGGELQCLGLLGLCNLSMETAGKDWLMAIKGLVNELADIVLHGVGGEFGNTGLSIQVRKRTEQEEEDSGDEAEPTTQVEGREALQNAAKTAAQLILNTLGLPRGMIPEPGAGLGNIEILSQRRARWERLAREDPTGKLEAAKARQRAVDFQNRFFVKEEVGGLKLTKQMVSRGVVAMWGGETKEARAKREQQDTAAEKVINLAVAQHGDRNVPSICYPKNLGESLTARLLRKEPLDPHNVADRQELLRHVRGNLAAWRTWLARELLLKKDGDKEGVDPLQYEPEVWGHFLVNQLSQGDSSGRWQQDLVMRMERKETSAAKRSWRQAGRKMKTSHLLRAARKH